MGTRGRASIGLLALILVSGLAPSADAHFHDGPLRVRAHDVWMDQTAVGSVSVNERFTIVNTGVTAFNGSVHAYVGALASNGTLRAVDASVSGKGPLLSLDLSAHGLEIEANGSRVIEVAYVIASHTIEKRIVYVTDRLVFHAQVTDGWRVIGDPVPVDQVVTVAVVSETRSPAYTFTFTESPRAWPAWSGIALAVAGVLALALVAQFLVNRGRRNG